MEDFILSDKTKSDFEKWIIKNKNTNGKLFNFINGLLTILDGLVKVLSIGYFRSDFSYKHLFNNLK